MDPLQQRQQLQQKSLHMPGTPRQRITYLPNETANIMIGFGGEVTDGEYVIRRIRAHTPNRYAEQLREMQREDGEEEWTDAEFEDRDGVRDLMGYIHYQGKTVRVVTGGYGDVEVWRIDHANEWEDE